jgi:hypothetical protein
MDYVQGQELAQGVLGPKSRKTPPDDSGGPLACGVGVTCLPIGGL